jgi:signal transduction histidine kinase
MEADVYARAQEVSEANRRLSEANAELARLNDRMRELDELKTQFLSNVSHEFRTPLTLMLGPIEDGLSDVSAPLSGRQKARFELAHDNALRLLKLVNALLDFSKLEAGRLQASFAPVDVSQFTAELAGMFQSAAEKPGIELTIDAPSLSAPVWLDRDMWEKIVPNLVSNALKFTREGRVAVRVHEEPDQVVLEVSDTGIGIPQEALPHIFERFYRVSQAEGRTYEGTGIGLALVHELVHLHGGHVTVDSAVGLGTTFRVHIPKGFAHLPAGAVSHVPVTSHTTGPLGYVAEAARWISARQQPGDDHTSAAQAPKNAKASTRILVVDDNPDLRNYLSDLLAPTYDVVTVPDGLAALEAIRERAPDLVVSDVMMPRLDGFALVRALRADARTASIPVILLSARAGEEASIQGLDAGSDDYLAKPFSARELLARVRTHVELARLRRQWVTELEQMNRELEAANRELDAFASSVAHDLRGPLSAVKGFSTLVVQDYATRMPAEALELLEDVRTASARMEQLIDDLLRFARVARQPLAKKPVEVKAVVQNVLNSLAPERANRSVEVHVGSLPDVVGDSSLLTQVFANLLSNAFKFTRHKTPARIDVGCERHEAASVFFVRDNGAGFDMRYASRLFGLFQRLHTVDEFEGTGVGLSTVERIVSRHGGRIWAEAEPGLGATFRFSLPD